VDRNIKAFLDMIAHSEIGPRLLAKSDNGYNVIVSGQLFDDKGTPDELFDDYKDHPRKVIPLRPGLRSTAAGRYQLLARYFDHYRIKLGLRDFSPDSQDEIAIQQIKEQRALPDVLAGRFDVAVEKCKNIWASLPGAGYGQHENKLVDLRVAYVKAGGTLA
jgi:muramidase (phage lysozyme)